MVGFAITHVRFKQFNNRSHCKKFHSKKQYYTLPMFTLLFRHPLLMRLFAHLKYKSFFFHISFIVHFFVSRSYLLFGSFSLANRTEPLCFTEKDQPPCHVSMATLLFMYIDAAFIIRRPVFFPPTSVTPSSNTRSSLVRSDRVSGW